MLNGPGGKQDGVELVLSDHRQVVAVRALAAVSPSPVLRYVDSHVAAGDDLGRRAVRRSLAVAFRDAAAADDANSDGCPWRATVAEALARSRRPSTIRP